METPLPATRFRTVRLSLSDLLGRSATRAVVQARARLAGERPADLQRLADRKVDLFPAAMHRALTGLLGQVGSRLTRPLTDPVAGATSRLFQAATRTEAAPLSGWGYFRVGEDGRLHFLTKSEHYHVLLGHGFPGYRLLEHARRLGIPNATHNNTRGRVTRLLEEELVRVANGVVRGDRTGLDRALRSRARGALNRVLNLETGSLAVEAGLKLMLARFYRSQADSPRPKYEGRTPVLVVIGDESGGLGANYHGTTVLAQVLRGMWPGLREGMARAGLLEVVPVRPEDFDGLDAVFERYDRGRRKIAGLCYELVLMNYGGRVLSRRFVRRIEALCRRHDVPTLADEIQSCGWSPRTFLFHEYGVRPTMVAVGKGLPGGEFSASRILFDATLDCLPQFGALVTNGQEEVASLAYLITIRWAEANAAVTAAVGEAYERKLRELAGRFARLVRGVEGLRHMASPSFHDLDTARAFARALNDAGLDISVQSYKTDCPPVALTKLPLIAGHEAAEMVVNRMERALRVL